jgi:pimeloyl-ACP methyl ester carboxylesterase
MKDRPGHGRALSFYDWGATPFYALQADPRFVYCAYVPQSYDEDDTRRYPLLVLVHGTERAPHTYRDRFADFCEAHHCIALAPLFPVGLGAPGDLDGYKFIEHAGIRYDLALLEMVAEVGRRWRTAPGLLLHGFSGGGHFAHRFAYLHPQALRAVSVGAPGVVTPLDSGRDSWLGVRDLDARFGRAVDLDALRRVQVQMVVGSADTQTWEIAIPPSSPWHLPGVNDETTPRTGRLAALARSFEAHGIGVQFTQVPDVAHDGWQVLPAVQSFFADVLSAPAHP